MDKNWLKDNEHKIKDKLRQNVTSRVMNSLESIYDISFSNNGYGSRKIRYFKSQYDSMPKETQLQGPETMPTWNPELLEYIIRVAVTASMEAAFIAMEEMYTLEDFERDLGLTK